MKFSIFASRAFSPNTSSRDLMREDVESLTPEELQGKINAIKEAGYQINAIMDSTIVPEQRGRSGKQPRC